MADKGAGNGMRDKVRERVRALRVSAKLIEQLDMDDQDDVAKIMPIINKAYDEMGAVAKDSGRRPA